MKKTTDFAATSTEGGALPAVSHIPDGQLTVTTSACPKCRKTVPAKVLVRSGRVYFEKYCQEHGSSEVLIADEAEAYLNTFQYHRQASVPLEFNREFKGSCPGSCGFCPEHEQHVCIPIIEITDHCDMTCPICLVNNHDSWYMTREEFAGILDRLIATEGSIDVVNLSGGEPTMHPEFEQFIEEALQRPQILRVSVSTNGLRLARDPELLAFLAEKNVVISLQYDGDDPDVLKQLRGADVSAAKAKVIEQIRAADAPASLTFTLVPGLNEGELAKAVDLLFASPNILSLMVQPAAYNGTGRSFAAEPRRIFIPEVTRLLAKHSRGRIMASDFSPLPCSHPGCFSLSFFLKTESSDFLSLKRFFPLDTYLNIIQNRALFGTDEENFRQIEDAVYQLWSGPAALAPDSQRSLQAVRSLLKKAQSARTLPPKTHSLVKKPQKTPPKRCACFDPSAAIQAAERDIKSVFIHGFMDADTFDLSRARKCCQVYPLADGRFMPICVYNVLERK
jgi:hypothetical protein